MDALNNIIASKQYHDVLSIIKGFRNGAVYGKYILIYFYNTVKKNTFTTVWLNRYKNSISSCLGHDLAL
jgi:hypothetical protein